MLRLARGHDVLADAHTTPAKFGTKTGDRLASSCQAAVYVTDSN